MARPEDEARSGAIKHYQKLTIIEMSKLVLDQIAANYAGIRERVGAIMGGVVLEHESKTIYNEGIEEGIQKGIQKGKLEGKLEGIQKGKLEGKREMVRRGLEENLDISLLARMAGVDVATVERWRDA